MKNTEQIQPLTVEHVRSLWSQTYNTEGKPDWSHIFPYYDDHVIFQDTIQRVEGIEAFKGVCERLTGRCSSLDMEILLVAQEGNGFVLQWVMNMEFKRFPNTPLYGCTVLTIGDNGKIVHQRDYYDLWGDVFNGIPGWRRIYRSFLHKYFG